MGGTWERVKDRFLLAAGDSYTAGETGGEATHTLTLAEMPNHRHLSNNYFLGFAQGEEKDKYVTLLDIINGALAQQYGTASAGGGQSHNNMPPYLTVYIWKRTA